MKNLLFGLLAMVMFGFSGNAKTIEKNDPIIQPTIRQACVVLSCCSIGPFGVEVFTDRVCVSFRPGNVLSIELPINNLSKEIVFNDDEILAGFKSDKGEDLIIPAGKYFVVNNSITVNASVSNRPDFCISEDISILGHGYHFSQCYKWIWNKTKTKKIVTVTITPILDDKAKQLLAATGTLVLQNSKATLYKTPDFSYMLEAGKYTVNSDGNIYIQNVKTL